jgi:hypothetical protein
VTQDRIGSVLAGGLVMVIFSLAYTALVFAFPASQSGVPNTQTNVGQVLAVRLAFDFFFVLFGAGLGGLGARSLQSRRVLALLNIMPPISPVLAQPPHVPQPSAQPIAATTPIPPAAAPDETTLPSEDAAPGD